MLKWVQSGISVVAGTAEPEYGPDAFYPINELLDGKNPFSPVVKEDLQWRSLSFTNVETQTFYLTMPTGHSCMIQIILSNLAGIRATAQFTCRIYHPEKPEQSVWTSTNLSDFEFGNDKLNFEADGVSVELSEDLKSYTFKSSVNDKSLIDVVITQEAPGCKIGKDGQTLYGTDVAKPWGTMRHIFWPRATVSGSVTVNGIALEAAGQAMYVMALQGMKPQHAASRWNFCNFQGPTTSAIMMEFTTPPSYGSTVVNVGVVARGSEILAATVENKAVHTKITADRENDWPEPTDIKFEWHGKSPDDTKSLDASIEAPIPNLVERVDVMAEIPQFVKKIVAGVAGTKPYIYQYLNPGAVTVKFGDEEYTEAGSLYNEATFIS
ncbi:oxidative stress survival, Svf1-like protein [Lipomyces arxii]|uniref:oxidative stress survival, Svf1-like protein n=1 Tax=Lipomyces arxii TaxID=56418 RepID=UPI0034CE8DC4